MNPAFDGRWRLTYAAFEPTGTYIGIVYQLRLVTMPDSGNMISEFKNILDTPVHGHPVGALEGDWSVAIESGTHVPRFMGPDVIGDAVVLDPTSMWSDGHWPNPGWRFTSISTLVSPWRQITGLHYYYDDPRSAVARLFGIAMPEAELGQTWPQIDTLMRPADISRYWRGTRCTYDSQGTVLNEHPLQRLYTPTGWIDSGPNGEVQQVRPVDHGLWLDAQASAGRVTVYGGIAASARLVDTKTGAYSAEYQEIFDAGSGTLMWVRRWLKPNDGVSFEWAQLKFSAS